ncbi:unnamed protein product [Soboliphyme baturini]|uniref:FERM domain-containing protein n=1 Tax=Soboliphyme baturini TaxID=241478 RepID=A0A183J818_9BILA|nr:unnamed protein product [Soboliphyme baturini]
MRDPCEHSMPHSIPVNLPDTSYQVIGFDGSSTVEECMLNLCQITSLRHPKLSGYCLFADDPGLPNALQPLDQRQKLCDVLSRWERSLKEYTSGKVPTRTAVRLYFRLRYYWGYDIQGETEQERIYLAYQMAEDMKTGHIPISVDLAIETCALLAQMHFGPCKGVNDSRIEDVINQSISDKVVAVSCKNVLKQQVLKKWCGYQLLSPFECATAVVKALRVWPHFGAKLFEATVLFIYLSMIVIIYL